MSSPSPFQAIISAQSLISQHPYSITSRLRLAKAYQNHDHPDLAVGEAYIALLLVDECLGDAGGEFEEEAWGAAVRDFSSGSGDDGIGEGDGEGLRERVGGEVRVGM